MFTKLLDALKATRRTIVFTEGPDARILEAASRLLKEDLMDVILIGNEAEVKAAAEKGNFCICKATIIDPATYEGMDEMVAKMVELRKGKMTDEECRAALSKGNYFGTMLVKLGKADALLGGATYSTADTVRPALQIIKTKPGSKIVSSCFIMVRPSATGENEVLAMADCAINIKPTEDELVEIAVETARTAKVFGIDPELLHFGLRQGRGRGQDAQRLREGQGCHARRSRGRRVPVRRRRVSRGGQDQAHHQLRGRSCQHLHLPRHQRRQHRLQDLPAHG